MNLPHFTRHGDGSNRRLPARRRPIVEDLEGRQLLSGIADNHIGIVADVQKVREAAAIQGNSIGTSVMSADDWRCHIHPNVA